MAGPIAEAYTSHPDDSGYMTFGDQEVFCDLGVSHAPLVPCAHEGVTAGNVEGILGGCVPADVVRVEALVTSAPDCVAGNKVRRIRFTVDHETHGSGGVSAANGRPPVYERVRPIEPARCAAAVVDGVGKPPVCLTVAGRLAYRIKAVAFVIVAHLPMVSGRVAAMRAGALSSGHTCNNNRRGI